MTVTDTLLDFALSDVRPSARATEIVNLSAIDWAACGLAGSGEADFANWATRQMEFGWSPTFAGRALTYGAAALVNGTLSHALDFDDTHFAHIGHPSVVVLSALMAAQPPDWDTFVNAALVGIEACVRIGVWLGRDHYERGFHQTATAGAFGACLGLIHMNKMLMPDPQATGRAALGLCASMASGLKAQFGTMGKPLNAGLAARAAVDAENWARCGLSGAPEGLEAFAQAHGAAFDARALEGIGSDWLTETLSHKFHACCHGLHATLEAMRGYDGGADVDHVEVTTHSRWMSVCNKPAPATGLEAKFSYRQVVAMALAGLDTGDIAAFSDEMALDPKFIALREKVVVVADETLSETQASVKIIAQGKPHALAHDLANPAALNDLGTRIKTKSQTLVGPETADGLWDAMRKGDLSGFRDVAFPEKRAPD